MLEGNRPKLSADTEIVSPLCISMMYEPAACDTELIATEGPSGLTHGNVFCRDTIELEKVRHRAVNRVFKFGGAKKQQHSLQVRSSLGGHHQLLARSRRKCRCCLLGGLLPL